MEFEVVIIFLFSTVGVDLSVKEGGLPLLTRLPIKQVPENLSRWVSSKKVLLGKLFNTILEHQSHGLEAMEKKESCS